jgi:hypothetical protein
MVWDGVVPAGAVLAKHKVVGFSGNLGWCVREVSAFSGWGRPFLPFAERPSGATPAALLYY